MSSVQAGRHEMVMSELAGDESVAPESFKTAFRNHPLGVAVVTAAPDDEMVAMTVSSLSSVSAEPPLLLFSASAVSSSTPVLDRASTVVVHMLGADQIGLAKLGAKSGVDRFADPSSWRRLPTGEPVYLDVEAWLRGTVVHRLGVGGSVVYIVHVIEAWSSDAPPSDPLVYHNRTWHRLGAESAIA